MGLVEDGIYAVAQVNGKATGGRESNLFRPRCKSMLC